MKSAFKLNQNQETAQDKSLSVVDKVTEELNDEKAAL